MLLQWAVTRLEKVCLLIPVTAAANNVVHAKNHFHFLTQHNCYCDTNSSLDLPPSPPRILLFTFLPHPFVVFGWNIMASAGKMYQISIWRFAALSEVDSLQQKALQRLSEQLFPFFSVMTYRTMKNSYFCYRNRRCCVHGAWNVHAEIVRLWINSLAT